MTREEFVSAYLTAEGVGIIGDDGTRKPLTTDTHLEPTTRIVVALVGSIYDLQQQVAELQDQLLTAKS